MSPEYNPEDDVDMSRDDWEDLQKWREEVVAEREKANDLLAHVKERKLCQDFSGLINE